MVRLTQALPSHAHSYTTRARSPVWKTCPYVVRDGQFNPDGRTINDIGEFEDMANAILYNALAWAINGSSVYSANVVRFVNTWFLAADTAMTPNLAYAQMQRGPNGQNGTHTGIPHDGRRGGHIRARARRTEIGTGDATA